MENKSIDRSINFDFIRTLAILFVICIHCMGEMEQVISSVHCGMPTKIVGALLNSIIHSGVPLFVMLSGALLLNKNEPISLFFKKRFKRILIPFFIWSLIVFIIKQLEDSSQVTANPIFEFLMQFISGGTHGIYWYIYLIIGLYLLTPILRVYFSNATKTQIYYLGICMTMIWLLGRTFHEIQIFNRFASLNAIYLTYFIFGGVAGRYMIKEKVFRKILPIGLLLSVVGGFLDDFYQLKINFPWIFFTSLFLFLYMLNMSPCKVFNRIVKFISSTSYGIYLSHFMFISLFLKLGFSFYVPVVVSPIVMTVIVLLIEMTFMYTIKRMKLDSYLM